MDRMIFVCALIVNCVVLAEKLDKDPKIREKQLRSKQKYVNFVEFYGRSVEGGKERAKVIIANKDTKQNKPNKESKANPKQGKASKKGKQQAVTRF